jgi:hypothetical protein
MVQKSGTIVQSCLRERNLFDIAQQQGGTSLRNRPPAADTANKRHYHVGVGRAVAMISRLRLQLRELLDVALLARSGLI